MLPTDDKDRAKNVNAEVTEDKACNKEKTYSYCYEFVAVVLVRPTYWNVRSSNFFTNV